jgi:transcriptional regulator with XRE-family HTH domain
MVCVWLRRRQPVGKANESGIGDRLKAARLRLGWSREELAVHAGVSWSAIAQAESGRRRNLRPGTLSSLGRALGVSIDYLVTGDSAPEMLVHQALLYDSDESFASAAGRFLIEGLERSEPALVVTSKRNLALLRDPLGSGADRVELLNSKDQYRTPEAILDLFRRFRDTSLRRGAAWVRVVGEPIWAGRSSAELRVWARYESMINLVLAASPMSVLCPYDIRDLDPGILSDARATHPQMVKGKKPVKNSSYRDPGAFAFGP